MDKLEIPEAAVEALYEFLREACWPMTKADRVTLRDGLAAALPHMPDRGYAEVGVKALEWHQAGPNGYWWAKTSFGEHTVARYETNDGGGWDVSLLENEDTQQFATLDEAKAAAQADYEARIRSALIAQPAPVDRGYAEGVRAAEDMHERAWALEGERGNLDKAAWHRECAATLRALDPPAPADNGEPDLSEAHRIIAKFSRQTPIADMTMRLFEAWVEHDPRSSVARFPTSYLATFGDLARAALSATPSPIEDVAPSEAEVEAGAEIIREELPSCGISMHIARRVLAARRVRPSPVDEDARDGVLEELALFGEQQAEALSSMANNSGAAIYRIYARKIRALQSQRKG